jgi:hypothetical protein
MSPHRFIVGQTVEFQPGPFDGNVPRGLYTITRQLPGDAHDREYRVKSERDGHERVMREKQLRAGAEAPRL